MIGWLLSLCGFCDHDFGWPVRQVQTCVRCGSTRASLVDLTPLPRFAAPIRPLVAVEAESEFDREAR
jgi:hypothetical protein